MFLYVLDLQEKDTIKFMDQGLLLYVFNLMWYLMYVLIY
jgi:hypothetical protein